MIVSSNSVRTAQEWEEALGAKVRAAMAAPEMARYFAVKMTQARARVALLQLSLFVSCRRDGWANLIANCDAPAVRQKLMEHEYDELVQDEYSSKGHYDLLIRQGALIGLTADDFANPDGDAPVNVLEYLYGTNPTSVDSPDPLQMSVVANKVTLTFPRDISATDTTATVQGADSASGP